MGQIREPAKHIHAPLQPAYKAGHSKEMDLIEVQNDMLINCSLDNHGMAVIILLDLSSAFDAIEQAILLEITDALYSYGRGGLLEQFRSYLTG